MRGVFRGWGLMVQVEDFLNGNCDGTLIFVSHKMLLFLCKRKPTDLAVPKRRWLRCHGDFDKFTATTQLGTTS